MKAIMNISSTVNGKIDVNGSWLHAERRTQRRICRFTDSEYISKKPLIVEFLTSDRIKVRKGTKYIEVTDSEYELLLQLPNPDKAKRWDPEWRYSGLSSATKNLELCKRMSDPYDRG